MLSLASLVLVILTGTLMPPCGESFYSALSLGFLLAGNILMIYPLNGENPAYSLDISMILFSIWLLFRLLKWSAQLLLLAGSLGVVAMSLMNNRTKFSQAKKLFSPSSVWQSVEEYARNVYFKTFYLSVMVFLCPTGRMVSSIISAALYAILYYRAYTTSTLVMSKKKEMGIRDMAAGNPHLLTNIGTDRDSGMDRLYDRVLKLMEDKKPFLDSEFTLTNLATATYSNKTYLSRTINLYSGRNFRQFVNSWRINYAKELIENDKHLRMAEVSLMCGFHTVVSFNMAFKVFTGLTPTEYHGSVHTKLQ